MDYIVAGMKYCGIISIYSKNKDFAGLDLNKNSMFFTSDLFSDRNQDMISLNVQIIQEYLIEEIFYTGIRIFSYQLTKKRQFHFIHPTAKVIILYISVGKTAGITAKYTVNAIFRSR